MDKQCNKCSEDLIVGDNWYASHKKNSTYTCKKCSYRDTKQYSQEYQRKNKDALYAKYKTGIKLRVAIKAKSINPGIYGIFNNCKLIYIGESTAPYRRAGNHFTKCANLRQAKIMSPVSYALSIGELQRDKLRFKMFEFIDDKQSRLDREQCLIQRYTPLYNDLYLSS